MEPADLGRGAAVAVRVRISVVESRTGAGALDAAGVLVPFPVPAHRTGRVDFPHPALRPASSLKLSQAADPGASGAGAPRLTGRTPPDSCPSPALLCFRSVPQGRGPSLHRNCPASPLLWPCPTSRRVRPPCRGRGSSELHPPGPPFLHCGFPSPACPAHYPGGPNRCVCRLLPGSCGLPRISGGSASAISLSRPAQAYCALRPAGLLAQLSLDFVTRLPQGRLPGHAARQLPCLPTTT